MSETRSCCIASCENKKRPVGNGLHYYGLPKNMEIRKKWLDWICTQNGTELRTAKAFVCSVHFKPEDKGPRNLKPRAIPCIVNNPVTETQTMAAGIASIPQTESQTTAAGFVTLPQTEPEARTVCEVPFSVNNPEIVSLPGVVDKYEEYSCVFEVDMSSGQSCPFPLSDNNNNLEEIHPGNLFGEIPLIEEVENNADILRVSCQPVHLPSLEDEVLAAQNLQTNNRKVMTRTCSAKVVHKYEEYSCVFEVDMSSGQSCLFPLSDDNNNLEEIHPGNLFGEIPLIEEVENNADILRVSCQPVHLPSLEDEVLAAQNLQTNNRKVMTRTCSAKVVDKYEEYSCVFEVDMSSGQSCPFPLSDNNNNLEEIHPGNLFGEIPLIEEVENNADISCQPVHLPSLEDEVLAAQNLQTNNRKVMTRTCSAKECTTLGQKLFSFPPCIINHIPNLNSTERCKKWVQNCGNADLLNVDADKLYKRRYLCSAHFETSQFYNEHRKKLLPNAVPTLFHAEPLTEEQVLRFKMSEGVSVSAAMFARLSTEGDFENNNDSHLVSGIAADDNPDNIQNVNSIESEYELDQFQKNFEKHMHSLQHRVCPKCKEMFMVQKTSSKRCMHRKNICPVYSKENNMDPGEVPPELKDLTYVEEQLIATVHPLVTVFRLNGHQFGYSGQVINFPQDVKEFARVLPLKLKDLTSSISVRTTHGLQPRDFQIQGGKVKKALEFLIAHNELYRDVEISEDNLNALPEDGNVYDEIEFVDDSTEEDQILDSNLTNDTADCDSENVPRVIESTVPMLGMPSEQAQLETVLEWPRIGKEPISEFSTYGYIARAFPCLFPCGVADLKAPRESTVTPLNYFKHLMRYHDGRFAKHARFRYFALNSIMRWQALTDGNMYVNLNSEYKDMTVGELKEKIKEDPNILKKIMFHSSNLKGTKSYWYVRGKELLAMIEQLGMPALFFTLSAADFHWPDLYKLLEPDEDPDKISESRRRKLIEENPMIVDSFFLERSECFIKEVLKHKLKVKDYWFRVEYQHRGSPHVHGVLWLEDAPDVTNLEKASEEEKQLVADYFHALVSTLHPNINEPKSAVHPCRLKVSDISDGTKDLAQLLNRVQRHTSCRDGYCLRKKKKNGKKECRFKFPQELACETKVVINSETGRVELITERNDPRLNKFNAYVIQTWRANVDISAVLSKQALITYLAKYISKPEKESTSMTDLLKIVMEKVDDSKGVKKLLQRLYIQCCAERDYSAQESCHLLMGLKLVGTDKRCFVTVNFSSHKKWVQVAENRQKKGKSLIQKYMERDEVYEHDCLSFMAKNYNFLTKGRYAKEAIVQVYPKLKFSKNPAHDNENFYKQEVLLYVPWRKEDDFFQQAYFDDGFESETSWKSVYDKNIDIITKNQTILCDLNDVTPEEEEYEHEDCDDVYSPEDWMCVSRMGPNQNADMVELGRREFDVNHDWNAGLPQFEQYGDIIGLQNFISLQKQTQTEVISSEGTLLPNVCFTVEQENIMKLLDLQIHEIKNPCQSPQFQIPKSIIVQGRAGTGKSLVIQAMKHKIEQAFGHGAYTVITPTGVSAKNVGGSTIHSKLHINMKTKEFVPLKGAAAFKMEEELRNTKFLIMDEFSMIGCQMMNMIEERLRQAKDKTQDFGNIIVYIFGDVKQLPPVGDVALYSDNQVSPESVRGKLVYDNFQAAVVLDKIMRQNDPIFQAMLNNVSEGTVSLDDYKLLQSRFSSNISNSEWAVFKDAIHLYPTRLQVLIHNKERLENLKDANRNPVPVARIPALHNCKTAAAGSTDDAEGLFSTIYLAEGAQIMLKSNIWTDKGLVNGCMGRVEHIFYKEESNPLIDPPAVILCKFEKYTGPTVGDNLVPIVPMTKSWTAKNGESCSRTQFPISLAYACSIHQSQGLTLDKAVINIGDKEKSPGLTYVALSRIKTLSGILLEPFNFRRLQNLKKSSAILKRNLWVDNLKHKDLSTALLF